MGPAYFTFCFGLLREPRGFSKTGLPASSTTCLMVPKPTRTQALYQDLRKPLILTAWPFRSNRKQTSGQSDWRFARCSVSRARNVGTIRFPSGPRAGRLWSAADGRRTEAIHGAQIPDKDLDAPRTRVGAGEGQRMTASEIYLTECCCTVRVVLLLAVGWAATRPT